MNTQTFIAALQEFTSLPQEQKAEFERLAQDLPQDQRQYIFDCMAALDMQLSKNDQKHLSSLQRIKAMTKQVEETDIVAFQKLKNA